MFESDPIAVEEVGNARAELKAVGCVLSHDLEAPLRGIKCLARILAQKHGDAFNSEANELLQLIGHEADRASHLLDRLLEWIRYGTEPLSLSWQNTTEIARSVFAELSAATPERNIEFHLESLPRLWSDRLGLRKVFNELLSNAVKFTRPRSSAIISISAEDTVLESLITIRDNGVGFDLKDTSRLFEMFKRLHHKKEFEGEGAGLAISRQILQRHQGSIWVDAHVGQGAAFHFSLPRPAGDQTTPFPMRS